MFTLTRLIAGALALTIPMAATAIEIPPGAKLPPAVARVINPAWPKVLKACPGLARYQPDMVFAGTEDNRSFADGDAQVVSVKFKVTDVPDVIPKSFGARGHMCFFEITPDGRQLRVPKTPCASICMGEDATAHIPVRSRVMTVPLR